MSIKNNTTELQEVLQILVNKAVGGEQATPEISVSTNGLITATAGDKASTKQLTTQAAKTVTPSTSSQTAVTSGVYTTGEVTVAAVPTQTKTVTPKVSSQNVTPDSGKFLSKVTVNGDSNLVASNIKSGVSIFGVTGTASAGINTSDATAAANEIFEGETAYVNGSKVTGTFTIEDELTEQDELLAQIEAMLANRICAVTETWTLTMVDGSTVNKVVELIER
jgi:hypothetical protein